MATKKKKLDFNKLFLYIHKLPIEKDGEEVGHVYQKLLNDADTEYVRAQALRASGEFRKRLRDENSDDHFSFIVPLQDLDKPELMATILIQEIGPRRERLQNDIPPVIPPKPKAGTPLEEQEEYQKEIDDIEKKWYKKITGLLEEEIKQRKDELEEQSKEELFPILRRVTVERLCTLRMVNVFQTWSTFFGTYKDKKCTQKYFDDFEEFEALPTEVLDQLVDGYFNLGLETTEIKK